MKELRTFDVGLSRKVQLTYYILCDVFYQFDQSIVPHHISIAIAPCIPCAPCGVICASCLHQILSSVSSAIALFVCQGGRRQEGYWHVLLCGEDCFTFSKYRPLCPSPPINFPDSSSVVLWNCHLTWCLRPSLSHWQCFATRPVILTCVCYSWVDPGKNI